MTRLTVPHGHRKTTTVIGGLRLSGMTVPIVMDGPMTGEWFKAYVEQNLAPTLRHGDIVFLDNLPAHDIVGARLVIQAVGAGMRVGPPYSPDFSAIENA